MAAGEHGSALRSKDESQIWYRDTTLTGKCESHGGVIREARGLPVPRAH